MEEKTDRLKLTLEKQKEYKEELKLIEEVNKTEQLKKQIIAKRQEQYFNSGFFGVCKNILKFIIDFFKTLADIMGIENKPKVKENKKNNNTFKIF